MIAAAMKLHAVYRATGKTNDKPRPSGFSKRRSLESFLRAWRACPAAGELVFQTDGEIPAAELALMEEAGRVVPRAGLNLTSSYWAALETAFGAGWPDTDLVYFGEDDYLYRPEAFAAVISAAGALPEADYLAPYATIGHLMPNGEPLHEGLRRPPRGGELLARVDDVAWHRATSHTLSYAVRLGALRRDRLVHNLALRASGAFDHTICLTCQGLVPYTPRELIEPLHTPPGVPASRRAKIVVWRLVLSALALTYRVRGARVIAAPQPALTSHCEVGLMAAATDWDAL